MRLYHSASSYALGQRCERAYAYHYVEKLVDPKVTWEEIAAYVAAPSKDEHGILWWHDPASPEMRRCTSRQRSTALGGAVHERIEGWYTRAPVQWHDLPGSVALSGLAYLPHPSLCTRALVESPIGNAAIVGPVDDHAPPVGFRVAGILWAGYRDLVVHAPSEFQRLGIHAPDGWALIDHKSSADIGRYALTPTTLRTDFQANLYALATMVELGLSSLPARWVYYETKRRRYAEPRDTVITRQQATEIVVAASERARHLDSLTCEADAEPNPTSCGDYGGCPYHVSAGGPCNAQRSFASLLQVRVPKKDTQQMPGLPASVLAFTGTAAPAAAPPGFAPPAPAGFAPAAQTGAPPGFAPPGAPLAPPPGFAPPQTTAAAAPEYVATTATAADVAAAGTPVAPVIPVVAGPAAGAPPPPVVEKKSSRKAAAAAQAPALPLEPAPSGAGTAAQIGAVTPADVEYYDIPGRFGMVRIAGDARDVLAALRVLRAA